MTSRTLIDGHLFPSHSKSVTFLDRYSRSVNLILTCPLNFSLLRIIPNHNLQEVVTLFRDFLSRYEKISHQISFGKLHSNTLDASNLYSIVFAVVSNEKRINKQCLNVKKLTADSQTKQKSPPKLLPAPVVEDEIGLQHTGHRNF